MVEDRPLRLLSLGLWLGTCLTIILAQGMQPDHKSRFPVSTFISKMSSELTSVHGNCSFPPSDVLTSRPNVNSYDFLEMCDRKIPSLDKPISDADVIMCLGLLELGLSLCSLEKKYFKNDVLFGLPSDSQSFNSLISVLNQQDGSDLCTNLKNVLDSPLDSHNVQEGLPVPVLKKWSLQKVFNEKEESCSRICFDYASKPQLLCKLILWGSKLLVQPEPKHFQAVISNAGSPSAKGNVRLLNNSVIGTDQTGKSGHGTSNQDGHDEQESQNDADGTRKDVETSNNGISSSPELESVGQAMPILKHAIDKSEILNKTDLKQNSMNVPETRNGQNESPTAMVSMEGMKNTDIVGSSTPSIGQEIIINENPQKTITKPSDAAAIGLDDNSKDIIVDEKPALSPAENIPTDIIMREDFRDHYDSPLDQNQDDDDVNFPVNEEEKSPMNHETAGYKTENKYPHDTDANNLQARFEDSEDSHFFSYFMAMVVLCIVGYVVFHNKQKIMALALEGRSKRTTRRRPATANYHKLDNNLEEAVSSPCNTSVTHVIY